MMNTTKQRGLSLIFAMLALVALSLAAVGLIRAIDSGSLVLGNLGFRQDATASSEKVSRTALAWMSGADLSSDAAAGTGYYATMHDTVDVTGQRGGNRELIDWDEDGCAYASGANIGAACTLHPKVNGNTQYVVFRLCLIAGVTDGTGQTCVQPSEAAEGECTDKGAVSAAHAECLPTGASTYYRIVVRSQGARNSNSFTETIVQM